MALKPSPLQRTHLRQLLRIATFLVAATLTVLFVGGILTWERVLAWRPPRILRPEFARQTAQAPAAVSRTQAPPPAQTQPRVTQRPAAATTGPVSSDDEHLLLGYLVDRFAAPSADLGPTARICENLTAAPPRLVRGIGQLKASIVAIARGGPEDAVTETLLAPLGSALRLPAIGRFVSELQAAMGTGDRRSLTGPDFNSVVALIAAESLQYAAALDARAQHASHLHALALATALNPSLASRGETQTLCADIEARLTTPIASTDVSAQTLTEEKLALLRWLAGVGLAPDQVGFDPTLTNTVRVRATAVTLSIDVPWVRKILGADFRFDLPVGAQEAPASVSGTTRGP